MLAMLVWTFAGVGLEIQADENAEKTYTEMKFSDWGKLYKTNYYTTNVYTLVEGRNNIPSLDKVAVSGTVNFNGVSGAYIRIGGNNNHTGFAFIDNGGCLKVLPQGIAGDTTAQTVIAATEWATLKNQDMKFRAAFYQEKSNWYIAVYINDELKGTYNCGTATPGTSIAYSVDTTTLAQQVTVTDINTEMKFSDWGKLYKTNYYTTNVYTLVEGRNNIPSLDKVAVSGTVNFNGVSGAYIRIGGNNNHTGFAFIDNGGCLKVLPQGIAGDTTAQTVIAATDWSTLKNQDMKFRAAFYKEESNWYIAVYINDELKGTYNCGTVTPGTSIAYSVDTTTLAQQVTVLSGYTEMLFSDWTKSANSYSFTDYTTYLYALPDNSSIKSLDDIAISGKVNFNEIKNHQISVGGIDTQRYIGFWLRATDEDAWNLSAQGIGAGASVTMRGGAISFNQDIILRMTFDEVTKNSWMVCVYANGTYVGSKTFEGVTPGLYIGIPEDITVEGKNTVYELSGTETTYEESGTTYYVGETVSEDENKRVVVYKTGDANKDAICNIADLVRMKEYTTEIETARIEYTLAAKLACDFDKDSQLSDIDTKLLRKYILLNGELGK